MAEARDLHCHSHATDVLTERPLRFDTVLARETFCVLFSLETLSRGARTPRRYFRSPCRLEKVLVGKARTSARCELLRATCKPWCQASRGGDRDVSISHETLARVHAML